jgi:phage tail sheath protein FI
MPFQVSPGVNVSEIDLTTIVPAVDTSSAGMAGHFRWGPVDQIVLLSNETELVDTFNKPNANTADDFFTAANFLSYANSLQTVRVVKTGTLQDATAARNAHTGGGASIANTVIKNEDDYEENYSSGISSVGEFIAKYPGELGNSLKVSTCVGATQWEASLAANLVFTAGSTSVLTKGANTTSDLTSGPNVDLSSVIADGDLLYVQDTDFNINTLKVASLVAGTITLETAPTQEQLSTTDNTTKVQSNSVKRRWEYYNFFDNAPGTSDYATRAGGSGDELHIAIVDEDGLWTNVKNNPIERFAAVSLASDAKTEDGSTNYYKNVVNNRSNYVWWAAHDGTHTSAGSLATTTFSAGVVPQTNSFVLGKDGSAPANADYFTGYDKFKNVEELDVAIMLGASANSTRAVHLINNIAEFRKDCVVVLSPERADVVDNATYPGKEVQDIIAYRNTLPSSSYSIIDSGWKYQYDKYNDLYRYVPLNGDVAGTMVRTDNVRDPWYSPAGLNRGQIKNVIRLAFTPNKAERDELYKNGVNPVVSFPGQGTVLFGDKTMLSKPSAFDRINVRRLFIVLEKAISTASKFTLFEFNDEFTRANFVNLVEPFLRDVQGRRGITDFRVVCDETNNTAEVIDRNEFIGDIFIKPARSINFIQLNFVAVRTGVDFSEVVGQV